jgi:hypothetical protein
MTKITKIALIGLLASQNIQALTNEDFSLAIAGHSSIKYSEYFLLMKDGVACMQSDSKSPTCTEVENAITKKLNSAFIQATLIAELQKNKQYCSEKPKEMVLKESEGEIASYAKLIIEDRVKMGSSLYGSELDNTYISKIIVDGLTAQHPCQK